MYQAAGLSSAAEKVWEFRLPTRPRFVRDLLCIPVQDGVYLFGGETQRLGGASVEWVLQVLVPLLDGTRTISDLLAELPTLSESSLRDTLYFMHMHGMLEAAEDGSADSWRETMETELKPQLAFFSRYLRITGHCRSRYDAQRVLQQARVGLVGEPGELSVMSEHLSAMGVGKTVCTTSVSKEETLGCVAWDVDTLSRECPVNLVVCIGDQLLQESITRDCLSAGWPVLCLDPTALTLGPLVYPQGAPCPVCVRGQLEAYGKSDRELLPAVRKLWQHALISNAAQQVMAHLTGLWQPSIEGYVESWHPSTGQTERRSVVKLPNCPACGDMVTPLTVTLETGHRDNLALLYHRAAAIQPWQLQQPAGMQKHLSPSVQRLTRSAYMQHSWAERLPLPSSADDLGVLADTAFINTARATPSAPVALAQLGTLLRYSAGADSVPLGEGEYYLRRYLASSGNLGSAEVYLIAMDLEGLQPGLYHYLVVDHTLEVLRPGHFAHDLISCIPSSEPTVVEAISEAAAVLVITSAVGRQYSKYSQRGYQYCLLDAGLLAHRLDLLTQQIGLGIELAWNFYDEQLADLVGLDGIELAASMLAIISGHSGDQLQMREPQQ